jgi:hypothetical protein
MGDKSPRKQSKGKKLTVKEKKAKSSGGDGSGQAFNAGKK